MAVCMPNCQTLALESWPIGVPRATAARQLKAPTQAPTAPPPSFAQSQLARWLFCSGKASPRAPAAAQIPAVISWSKCCKSSCTEGMAAECQRARCRRL